MYYERNTGGLWLRLGLTLLAKVFRPAYEVLKRNNPQTLFSIAWWFYIVYVRTLISLLFSIPLSLQTCRFMSCSNPKVDIWQSLRVLEWVLVFWNSTTNPKVLWYHNPFEKRVPLPNLLGTISKFSNSQKSTKNSVEFRL